MGVLLSGLNAQVHYFEKILTEEGESNLSVRQIIQDKNGFLWIATFSGVYRYEGNDFIFPHTFKNNEEINSDVTSLLCDNSGNIWIGTNQGLSKYNMEKDELITYLPDKNDPSAIISDKIRSLALGKDGRIWIGTSNAGLICYNPDDESFSNIPVASEGKTSPLYIKTIFIDSKGVIWLGTLGNGLYGFNPEDSKVTSVKHFQTQNTTSHISDDYVYCIYEDVDGTIIAGTRNGLNILDSARSDFREINTPGFENENMRNYFRSIYRDEDGKLWIGTFSGIIVCYSFSDLETGRFITLKHNRNIPYSISHDQILNIFHDNSGVIWIGTENGLNKYSPYQNQFQPLSGQALDKLTEQTATAFCKYKDGLLILTLSDGLVFKNKNGISTIFGGVLMKYHNEKWYAISVDSDDNIWLGSYRGLLIKIDSSLKKALAFKHSKNNVPIYSIVESGNGILLIGTGGEGMKYFDSKTEKFSVENSLSGDVNINHIFLDSKGDLWIAAQLGIFRSRKESHSFEYYLPDNPDSIANPNIFSEIAESADGEIYAGGRNGLYLYDPISNTFNERKFDVRFHLWVTNLQFDSNQNLWLNLNFNRIGIIDKATGSLRVFTINNGIRSIAHNRRGFFIDENDDLYVSGFDQISRFDISNLVTSGYSPKPMITKLVIKNTEVRAGMELNNQVVLKNDIKFQNNIVLNHNNKDFTLHFKSASFVNPRDNEYRYILHGYDEKWHQGRESVANYTNLDPGKYEFEVYSANNDGYWSESSAKLFIKVRPAPLLSWWAFCIYIFVAVALFVQIRKFIVARMLLKQELVIERVKRDKEEKFNQERLRFYTNVSHELRTPLTLIMAPVKQLIAGEEIDSVTSKMHHLILNNAQRLLSLTNQLLEFRKSTYEGMKLKVTYLNISEIVRSNVTAFEFVAKEKFVTINYREENEEAYGWIDLEKFDMVLFNILSNAFKYTPDNGTINIYLKTLKTGSESPSKHVELTVSNSGKGIPRHLQQKVFERFYQIRDASGPNDGSGIGLSIIKTLVELHHGMLSLESEPGKFTTFIVSLPVDKEAYSDIEIFDFKRDTDRRTKELFENTKKKRVNGSWKKGKTDRNKILLVEDNEELREFLFDFLSDDYIVYTASDGLEGIAKCMTNNPDLVISDVMMEKVDGFQFCSKLKSNPEISHIPVILMTALASVENKITGYKTGADDYITKPFEPELLKIRIQNILENAEKARKSFRNELHISALELTRSKTDEIFLHKVIGLLEDNLDNSELDIETLCKSMAVSSSQLYRKIRSITGLSPNEFIRTYRLKKAAALILEADYNISEVAYKVGFNDALYFSKCFKKHFGYSPSSYASKI